MVALDLDGQMARDSAVAAIDSLARGHDGREGARAAEARWRQGKGEEGKEREGEARRAR
jgi:hypothetical protein